jgi:hypothetical protein
MKKNSKNTTALTAIPGVGKSIVNDLGQTGIKDGNDPEKLKWRNWKNRVC